MANTTASCAPTRRRRHKQQLHVKSTIINSDNSTNGFEETSSSPIKSNKGLLTTSSQCYDYQDEKENTNIQSKESCLPKATTCKSIKPKLSSSANRSSSSLNDNGYKVSTTSTSKSQSHSSQSTNDLLAEASTTTTQNPISCNTLLSIIAQASIAFPNTVTNGEGSILLENKKVELVNVARRCLKESLKGEYKKDYQINIANLRIAIHSLRAITPLLFSKHDDTTHVRQDLLRMNIQLTYHCITTCEKLQTDIFPSIMTMTTNNEDSKGDGMILVDSFLSLTLMSMAAYQTLGMLLYDKLLLSVYERCTTIRTIFDFFPIPKYILDLDNGQIDFEEKPLGDILSSKELMKICVESTYSICIVVKNFLYHTMNKPFGKDSSPSRMQSFFMEERNFLRNEFGVPFANVVKESLFKQIQDDFGGSYLFPSFSSFQKICMSTLISWSLSPSPDSDDSYTSGKHYDVVTLISTVKRVQKVTSDIITHLDEMVSTCQSGLSQNGDSDHLDHIQRAHLDSLLGEGIHLRQDLVMSLLLYYRNIKGDWVSLLPSTIRSNTCIDDTILKMYQRACKLGWQYPASLKKTIRQKRLIELLHESFYIQCGSALDEVAIYFEEEGTSYMEYCAHRAMQQRVQYTLQSMSTKNRCEQSDCLFNCVPFKFMHSRSYCCTRCEDSENNKRSAAICLFFFSLYFKDSSSKQEDVALLCQMKSKGDEMISIFQECFSCDSITDKCEDDDLQYAFNLLSYLRLISWATDVVKSKIRNVSEFLSIHFLSQVLGHAFAPLCSTSVSKIKSSNIKFCNLTIESYIRSASVLNYLSIASYGEQCENDLSRVPLNSNMEMIAQSDQFLINCHSFCRELSTKQISTLHSTIENAAKLLSIIGKQRIEQSNSNSSLIPLILSIDLFSTLQKTCNSNHQISARYHFLASLMLSQYMMVEACVALLFSIKYTFLESPKKGSDDDDDLLNEITSLCMIFTHHRSNSLATRDYGETQSATTKLVSIILDMLKSPNTRNEKKMFDESICASIQNKHCIDYLQCVSRVIDSDHNLLLANLVQNTLLCNETSSAFLTKDRLHVIRNLIHNMGASISGIFKDKDTKKIVENNLDVIVSSTASYFKQAEISHFDLLAQFYSTTAISFELMIENMKSSDCLDIALRYVDVGLKDNPKKLMLLVYKVSLIYSRLCSSDCNAVMNQNISLHEFFLPRWNKSKYDNLLSLCASIVDLIFQQQEKLGENYYVKKVLKILSYILSFVYNDLHVEGLSIVAAKYSLILLKRIVSGSELIATHTMLQGELYHDVEVLFETASDDLKKSRKCKQLLSIMKEISSIFENKRNAEFTSREELDNFLGGLSVKISDLSIQLTIFVKASDYTTVLEFLPFFSNYMSQCKAIREKINNDENLPSILLVLIEYWVFSCYEGMGDSLYQIGDPLKALSWYRLSIVHCKSALEYTKNKNIFPRPDCANALCNYYSLPGVYLSKLKQLFMKMGIVYSQLGDYRKSSSYAISLMESVGFIGRGHLLAKRTSYSDVLKDLNICVSTPSLIVYRRFMLSTLSKCRSPAWNKEGFLSILSELDNETQHSVTDSNHICSENLDYYRETVKDFLLLGDTFQGFKVLYEQFGNIFPLKEMSTLSHAINNLPLFRSVDFINKSVDDDGVKTLTSDDKTRLTDTICEVALKLANMLLLGEDKNNQYQAVQILKTIESMSNVPRMIRLQVLYNLGLRALNVARQNGELYELWSSNSDIYQSFESLDSAYTYFYDAAMIAGPSSLLTSRKVLRCLALVTGPEAKRRNRKIPAGELVHTSIGGSARIQASVINYGNDSNGEVDEQAHSLLDAFDLRLHDPQRCVELQKIYQLSDKFIPHSWKLSAFALCPTGELLISSFNHKDVSKPYRTVCVFPTENTTNTLSEFSESILTPFDDLIERSRKQLKGLDIKAKEAYNKDSNARKKWWDERLDIDQNLEEILIKLNDFCFSSAHIKELLFGGSQATPSPIYDDIQDLDAENLAARFEAACSIESVSMTQSTATRESLNQMTVIQLKERLGNIGIISKEMRGLRKSELIDLLISKENDARYQSESQSSCDTDSSEEDESNDDCYFIILDEQISRLPFEGTSTLKNKTVCRIPSIVFALSSIIRSNSDSSIISINPSLASYVLDPESNLLNSRERLQPKLDQLSETNSWNWKKVVGTAPSEEFMKEALLKPNGLFIFCGHGGGERFFSRYQIEKLKSESAIQEKGKDNDILSLPCQSSVILMGCSSGKLTSVNECVGQSSSNIDMHFEPEGASLSYLCAGAPCVVGNLWDVTDRDIDKFFLTFLDLFMGTSSIQSTKSLPKCLAESRDVCKMKHIVGCAPVVYGIPLYLLRN